MGKRKGYGVKEAFLRFIELGTAMTAEEVAAIVRVTPGTIKEKARQGLIPRLSGIKPMRFDPQRLIEVFCAPSSPETARSLKIVESVNYAHKPVQRKDLWEC